jgi:hypothetical protein
MKIVADEFDDAADLDVRYRKLESSMCDMGHMFAIATQNVFDLTEHHQYSDLPEEYRGEIDHTVFLMFQLDRMFTALKEEYDGGFSGKRRLRTSEPAAIRAA